VLGGKSFLGSFFHAKIAAPSLARKDRKKQVIANNPATAGSQRQTSDCHPRMSLAACLLQAGDPPFPSLGSGSRLSLSAGASQAGGRDDRNLVIARSRASAGRRGDLLIFMPGNPSLGYFFTRRLLQHPCFVMTYSIFHKTPSNTAKSKIVAVYFDFFISIH